MADISDTYLMPVAELTPGSVSAIRNTARDYLIDETSARLSMPTSQLVVRDIRPIDDLVMCASPSTPATNDDWEYTGGAAHTWEAWSDDDQTMGDQRFVILYGVRDLSMRNQAWATTAVVQDIALVKLDVGNATKAIWDVGCLGAYALSGPAAAVTNNPILIPQNVAYLLKVFTNAGSVVQYLQLMGLVCEPRGKVISP